MKLLVALETDKGGVVYVEVDEVLSAAQEIKEELKKHSQELEPIVEESDLSFVPDENGWIPFEDGQECPLKTGDVFMVNDNDDLENLAEFVVSSVKARKAGPHDAVIHCTSGDIWYWPDEGFFVKYRKAKK